MKISFPDDQGRRERLVLALIEGEESGLSDRTVHDNISEAKSSRKPNLIA